MTKVDLDTKLALRRRRLNQTVKRSTKRRCPELTDTTPSAPSSTTTNQLSVKAPQSTPAPVPPPVPASVPPSVPEPTPPSVPEPAPPSVPEPTRQQEGKWSQISSNSEQLIDEPEDHWYTPILDFIGISGGVNYYDHIEL